MSLGTRKEKKVPVNHFPKKRERGIKGDDMFFFRHTCKLMVFPTSLNSLSSEFGLSVAAIFSTTTSFVQCRIMQINSSIHLNKNVFG